MTKTDKALKLFFQLAKIYSPSGKETNCANFIKNYLDKLKIKNQTDKAGNIIADVPGNKNYASILLTAHMDTVEPGENIQPFIDKKGFVRAKKKTIVGADNKLTLAVILNLLRQIKEKGLKNNIHPLELIFTVREEANSQGAMVVDVSKLKSKFGYCADIGNAPFGDIVIAAPFYYRLKVEVVGKAAHASRPDKAVNALLIVAVAINQIPLGKIDQETCANIGVISGGTAANTIPGNVKLVGEIRSMTKNKAKSAGKEIINKFKIITKKAGAKLKFEIIEESSGYKYSARDQVITRTRKRLQQLGLKPKLISSWSGSDANIFVHKGLKIINIAEGSVDTHTINERFKVETIKKLNKVFYQLIKI